jgi:4-amino-4-deoxychorismate lyase
MKPGVDHYSVFVNGQPTQQVAVFDRGLQFGDGVFETIAAVDGRLCQLDKHLRRLQIGLQRLSITPPDIDASLAIAREQVTDFDAVIKLIVTRGESMRGYRPAVSSAITVILQIFPGTFSRQLSELQVIDIGLCETPLSINPVTAGIKHLNRLDQVLASIECQQRGLDDGLMCIDEHVIESTSSNLFLWHNNRLLTPWLNKAGISGTVRACVFEAAEEMGVEIEEGAVSIDQCHNADALFLTNAISAVRPVRSFDGRRYASEAWPTQLFEKLLNNVYS